MSDTPRMDKAFKLAVSLDARFPIVEEGMNLERELTMEMSKKTPEVILMLMETVKKLEEELKNAKIKIDSLSMRGD